MKEDKQKIFNDYIEEFSKLTTVQKNSEIVERQIEIIKDLIKYANSKNIKYNFLNSKEVNDIAAGSKKIDDYLEAIMVYNINIEEIIWTIINSLGE